MARRKQRIFPEGDLYLVSHIRHYTRTKNTQRFRLLYDGRTYRRPHPALFQFPIRLRLFDLIDANLVLVIIHTDDDRKRDHQEAEHKPYNKPD